MIKKNYGDGRRYELEYPRVSLLYARIQFINAIKECAPQVFEDLHYKPLKAYKSSGLQMLHKMRLVKFWEKCIGGGNLNFYLNGVAPIEKTGPFMPLKVEEKTKAAIKEYQDNGATEKIRSSILLPGGDKRRIEHHIHSFISDFGLNMSRKDHVAHFEQEIYPNIILWKESLEEWASKYNLSAGWMLHWAFLKLDTYIDKQETPYKIFRELNPPLIDIFGCDVQPPLIEAFQIQQLNLEDYWINEFHFEGDPWRPLVQSEEEFERRMKEDFDKALKRYLADCRQYLDLRKGIVGVRVKREKIHYKWLARYQCLSERIVDIAKTQDEEKDRKSVREAIKGIADFIGLPIRSEDPVGRRQGTADSKPRKNRGTAPKK